MMDLTQTPHLENILKLSVVKWHWNQTGFRWGVFHIYISAILDQKCVT